VTLAGVISAIWRCEVIGSKDEPRLRHRRIRRQLRRLPARSTARQPPPIRLRPQPRPAFVPTSRSGIFIHPSLCRWASGYRSRWMLEASLACVSPARRRTSGIRRPGRPSSSPWGVRRSASRGSIRHHFAYSADLQDGLQPANLEGGHISRATQSTATSSQDASTTGVTLNTWTILPLTRSPTREPGTTYRRAGRTTWPCRYGGSGPGSAWSDRSSWRTSAVGPAGSVTSHR
jgi:hypothetical protein